MRKALQVWKVIIIDSLGVVLIVISPFTGVLPGPGGLPIFLAGLGLLSLNHQWARNLLLRAKRWGLKISNTFIRENTLWQLGMDVLGLLLVCTAAWLFLSAVLWTHRMISISLIFLGIYLLLMNRSRGQSIKRLWQNRTKKPLS